MTTEAVLAGERAWHVAHDDTRAWLRSLPDGCAHTCITSPPYYSLRAYGTEPQAWGGDPAHVHQWGAEMPGGTARHQNLDQLGEAYRGGGKKESAVKRGAESRGCWCACGSWLGELWLEPTPQLFVDHLVEVFREVRRVLHSSGTAFVNLGDSYAGSGMTGGTDSKEGSIKRVGRMFHSDRRDTVPGMKPKDLLGIPLAFAFAMRADGWYLRQWAPWVKRAAMPESVTDRPASALECVFQFSKAPRYFYDHEAVRKSSAATTLARDKYTRVTSGKDGPYAVQHDHETPSNPGGRNRRNADWWFDSVGMLLYDDGEMLGFDVTAEPMKAAHFAVFPTALVEPMVLAGTSERGVCPKCWGPWERVTNSSKGDTEARRRPKRTAGMDSPTSTLSLSGNGSKEWAERGTKVVTVGWKLSCKCNRPDTIPALVIDPFAGSGTTIMVANRLGRRGLGCDLNSEYVDIARRRILNDDGMEKDETVSGPPMPLYE